MCRGVRGWGGGSWASWGFRRRVWGVLGLLGGETEAQSCTGMGHWGSGLEMGPPPPPRREGVGGSP